VTGGRRTIYRLDRKRGHRREFTHAGERCGAFCGVGVRVTSANCVAPTTVFGRRLDMPVT